MTPTKSYCAKKSQRFDSKKKRTVNDTARAIKARWSKKKVRKLAMKHLKIDRALKKNNAAAFEPGLTQKKTSLDHCYALQMAQNLKLALTECQKKEGFQDQYFANAAQASASETNNIHESSSPDEPSTSPQQNVGARKSYYGNTTPINNPPHQQQFKSTDISCPPKQSPRKKSCPPSSPTKRRTASSRSAMTERMHTPEQLVIVNYILRQNTDAEVLSVAPTASVAEINKAFKKLALKIHPDKNPSPGAARAFHRLQNAAENMRTLRAIIRHPVIHNPENAHADIRDDSSDSEADAENGAAFSPLAAFMIFLVIALVISSFIARDGGVYRMEPTGRFTVARTTCRHELTYYVSTDFMLEMRGMSIRDLETKIEVDFVNQKRVECNFERSTHLQEMMQAKRGNLMIEYQRLLKQKQPACEELVKFSLSRNSVCP